MNSPIYLSMPNADTEDTFSIPLEKYYFRCGGAGTREDDDGLGCLDCEGHGVIPTHFGLQILNFVKRWQS